MRLAAPISLDGPNGSELGEPPGTTPGRIGHQARRLGQASFWPTIAVIASLLILAPLLVAAGANVLDGYRELFSASFGSTLGFGLMLVSSVPLILVGLGVALPYRAGLFNIGGEGQLLIGALVGVYVATSFGGGPGAFLLPLIAAFAGGAIVGAIPGLLKARGISEIVTTIMISFIVLYFVQGLLAGSLRDDTITYAASELVPNGFRLDRIAGGDLPVGFLVAIAVALVAAWWTTWTRAGWRQRIVGLNAGLAARQGVSVPREQVLALTLGGGLAGMGGAAELIGNQYRLGSSFSPGWGFTAVAIALLARGNMLAVVPFAMFFGLLQNGESSLQANLGVPGNLVLVLAGAPVIIVAAVLGYRNYRRSIAEPPDD